MCALLIYTTIITIHVVSAHPPPPPPLHKPQDWTFTNDHIQGTLCTCTCTMYLPVVTESKVDATRYLCSINPFQHPSHTLIAASSKFLERNKQHLPRHSHLVPHLSINCIGILFVHLHLLNS